MGEIFGVAQAHREDWDLRIGPFDKARFPGHALAGLVCSVSPIPGSFQALLQTDLVLNKPVSQPLQWPHVLQEARVHRPGSCRVAQVPATAQGARYARIPRMGPGPLGGVTAADPGPD